MVKKMNKNDITVMIPLVSITDEIKPLIDKSVKSIDSGMKVIFIGPKDAIEYVSEKYKSDNYTFLESGKYTDLSHQVNKAVKSVSTEYFSVLEYDDEYTPIWFNNVEKYFKSHEDVSVFLPLIEVYDYKKPELGALGYMNEVVWASSFSDELGYLDTESLSDYFSFNVTGSVINTKDFISFGGLKSNIKVFMWYELLLRLSHNSKKLFVIPKAGYNHYINRDGSMVSEINSTMTPEEIDFWFNTAKGEYMYKTDRPKSYQPKE